MRFIIPGLILIPIIFLSSCSGCSRSGRMKPSVSSNGLSNSRTNSVTDNVRTGNRIVIKMKKENGVYKIPVLINGVLMDFIFDTGAGLISISYLEANFLYKQGKITKEDILGSGKFQDATGTISDGAIINLREVSLGGRTIYNIHAAVTNNENAPLLLGQSALEKFGKITIDYSNGEVIFQ